MARNIRGVARSVGFLMLTIFIVKFFWIAGCSTQKAAVTASHKESVQETRSTIKAEAGTAAKVEKGITEESLKCITCHEERGITHGWIADWEGSSHARKAFGCEACHVSLAGKSEEETGELEYLSTYESKCEDKRVHRYVIAGICGKCHKKEYDEFTKSRHSAAWQGILKYGQFSALSKEVRANKCGQCHNIQFKCDSCHTRHTFRPLEAKNPEACRTCHTGADQPYYDIYISSKHGAVYTASQADILKESESVQALRSPVCITCHMPQGTHNISIGLTSTQREKRLAHNDQDNSIIDNVESEKNRTDMLSVCNSCHSPNFARNTLTTADMVNKDADAVIREVKGIVLGLEKDGLIRLSDNNLIGIPSLSHAFIPGNLSLYSGRSRIEYLYNELLCSAAVTSKGAYHMNPNYTYLYGFVNLQKNLDAIREEAKKLREEAEIRRKRETKLR